MKLKVTWLLAVLAASLIGVNGAAQESLPTPRVAISTDRATAYIAQFEPGKILRLTSERFDKAEQLELVVETAATHIVAMQLSETGQELLLACDQPPRLVRQPLDGSDAKTITLPAAPARIALTKESDGRRYVCITLPTLQSVWIGVLSQSADMDSSHLLQKFSPKEVIGWGSERFILADAVGNRIQIVSAGTRKNSGSMLLNGYHIGGLALDASAGSLLVAHQVLSSNARTDRDDIRWGSLIQNNVSSISMDALLELKPRLTAEKTYRIGDFGRGSADPADVVAMDDTFAVAIAGTNEVAIYNKQQHQAKFVQVGMVPEQLYRLGSDRLLCSHRLDQRIAVIKLEKEAPKLERMLGKPPQIETAEQRGELAYFSGQLSHDGWMSCNSCHIERGSPDLLVDTLGDSSYDSPKKIPALDNVTQTGPWAWHGGQVSLKDQLAKTLSTTMHTPDEFAASSHLTKETLVDDLIAYLASRDSHKHQSRDVAAPVATSDESKAALIAGGEALFHQHCGRCHDPGQHFTSPRVYDVGINDERGQKQFNPPSLIGLRHRTRYLHDGRFQRLDQILTQHPQPAMKFTEDEQAQLKAYLLSL